MERMGHEPRASVLERQFNLRYQGEPVTYHGVRRWLQGETLPTVDKLQVLAGWLGLSVDPFMAALQGGTEETESRYRFSKIRVNPRPIGRGYKRKPRSGSILVWLGSAHTLSVFR